MQNRVCVFRDVRIDGIEEARRTPALFMDPIEALLRTEP